MGERIARCACGALSVRCDGEPARISLCHCDACKRKSGSAFSFNATFRDDQLVIAGRSSQYERFGEDGGGWVRQHFCPTCGTTLFHRIELRPGMVTIAVGGFADPDFPPPTVEVYAELAQRGLALAVDPAMARE